MTVELHHVEAKMFSASDFLLPENKKAAYFWPNDDETFTQSKESDRLISVCVRFHFCMCFLNRFPTIPQTFINIYLWCMSSVSFILCTRGMLWCSKVFFYTYGTLKYCSNNNKKNKTKCCKLSDLQSL